MCPQPVLVGPVSAIPTPSQLECLTSDYCDGMIIATPWSASHFALLDIFALLLGCPLELIPTTVFYV